MLDRKMEIVSCDLCGANNYKTITSQTDLINKATDDYFTIVECLNCGLNFTNPRPSLNEIGTYYTENYSFHHSGGIKTFIKTSVLGRLIEWIANSPFAYIFAVMPPISNLLGSKVKPKIQDPVLKYIKQGKINNFLDIGCGAGVNPHFWGAGSSLFKCSKRIEAYGCEPDESSRNFLNDNGILCWPSIEKVDRSKKFDLIRMNWSLEHVHAPSKYFEFFNNHLSAEGKAIISVPNYKGLIYRLSPSCVELPVHLYHLSVEDFRGYAKNNNLELISSYSFSYPGMFSAADEFGLLPHKFSFPRGIIFAKRLQKTLNLFDKFGMGNDIVVILKKRVPN